jgi:glycosyltransferase involved in cell wall biosynthesis
MAVSVRKKLLLLTLVHPDYLPPVYAIAQVLRDEGYDIHILTFEPFGPSQPQQLQHITIESVGKHHGIGLLQRLTIRRRYMARAATLVAGGASAIVSFCAFSLLCGIKIHGRLPLAYHSLELSDFSWATLRRSPLSQFNNLLAIRNIGRAGFISTASAQRSAWQVGRSRLHHMPYTILNTVYLPPGEMLRYQNEFQTLMPTEHRGKKVVLYMGSVNAQNCVIELVKAFGTVNDSNSVMVIAGIKDNEYGDEVRRVAVSTPGCTGRVVFFPFVKGIDKDALQSNAHIGVCLSNEDQNNAESMMTSPNKVGEYLAKGLYLLASDTEYMRPLGMKGVAALSRSNDVSSIAAAMRRALQAVEAPDCRHAILDFVKEFYCMQQQASPLVKFIKENGE